MRVYYHVIEEGNHNEIGSHGCFNNRKDAEEKVADLQSKFPNLFFYVYPSPSKNKPEFITI